MNSAADGVNVKHKNQTHLLSPSIVISSSILQPAEFEIVVPGYHSFGISPAKPTVMHVGYDSNIIQDIKWQPSTFGYLPPGMKQIGAITEAAESTYVLLSDDFFKKAARDEVDLSKIDFRHLAAVEDPVVSHLMASIGLVAKGGGEEEWPLLIDSISSSLAVRLMQQLGAQRKKHDLRADRMDRVIEYIKDNIDGRLSLDELSQVACLSQHHFARQFKTAFGKSPHEYVLAHRVDIAVGMIRRGGVPLSIIALKSGFCSQSHMNKAVKAQTGMTPGHIMRDAGFKVSQRE